MTNSKKPSPNSPSTTGAKPRRAHVPTLAQGKMTAMGWRARQARLDPVEFARFAFSDESGGRMRLGAVHRELHAFLSASPRGLVELPRDHGKTVQVLIRVLWELGRDPNLRVLIACAS